MGFGAYLAGERSSFDAVLLPKAGILFILGAE